MQERHHLLLCGLIVEPRMNLGGHRAGLGSLSREALRLFREVMSSLTSLWFGPFLLLLSSFISSLSGAVGPPSGELALPRSPELDVDGHLLRDAARSASRARATARCRRAQQ